MHLPCPGSQRSRNSPIYTAKVLVNATAPGLSKISTHANFVRRRLYLLAQRLVGNVSGRQFHVLVFNFCRNYIHVPKHMLIATNIEPPDTVEPLKGAEKRPPRHEDEEGDHSQETVSDLYYKRKEDQNTQMVRQTAVETEEILEG